MPYQDGTGPQGQGPMTGRGLGPCGRGLGFRQGFKGMGFRKFFQGTELTLSKEQEKKILEAQLVEVEAEKTEIEKRLKEIK